MLVELSMRLSIHLRRFASALLISLMMMSALANAEDINFLIQQLKTSDDFSVRVQAALALGATNDVVAVSPLCEVLGADSSDAVRAACAAGLGKLKKTEGLSCLKTRKEAESNASVKAAIEKAIKDIEKAGSAVPAGAKYYVAIGTPSNKTTRSNDEIEKIVRDAISAKLLSAGGFAVAPKGEASADATKVIKDKNLKGLGLQPTINAFSSDGSSLSLSLNVVMTTYPGKDIKGEVNPKVSMPGASSGDKNAEDALLKAASENAADALIKVAASL